jgi:hypothetical protein
MAANKKSLSGSDGIESHSKNTRQGYGRNTKYSATSRNKPRKPRRGQGKIKNISQGI